MKKKGIYEKYLKRALDILLSLAGIILLSPVLLIIALMVRIKLGSPVLFSQERPGKDEKIFRMYKFRTMTDRTDEQGELLPDEQRLTRFGKRLRATSLDELPELWNILKGDMSVIGPRPLLVRYLPYYHTHERRRSEVRPGITGLAQVNGRNSSTWEERFAHDIKYVEHISFQGDLKIFIATIFAIISKKDILVGSEHVIQDLDIERCKDEKEN